MSSRGAVYRRTALLGTGLIGGSLGIRLRERRLVREIVGYDRDAGSLALALERGAIDRGASSAVEAVRGAQLVVLAVPVLSVVDLVREILPALEPGAVITDVSSTKQQIMEELTPLLSGRQVYFIGGHPMAGSEESGIRGADPALLESAIYLLSPARGTPEEILERLVGLVEATGAQPLIIEPEEHDRLVALASHLPHLVAGALVHSTLSGGEEEMVRTLAAGGFRDTTRVALGSPEIWRDICLSNRQALARALEAFQGVLERLRRQLERGDAAALEQFFRQAREYRRRVPHRGRGILPELFELVVLVPDTPGVIGRLATLLGETGINIASIEILHVRELEGGSLRLGFREEEHREAALELLRRKGYRAHCRR
ncbi:MAG TPA: prephenate dehydrogenase [Bacillota bacterium]|nr:prephenate dehydrogenase [Bacillota bacterium]HPT33294.1 prephenate dehydrogenase [Bacillota bacterium]